MKKITLLSAFAVLLLVGVRAQADVLDVVNGDFESDTVGSYTVPDSITGWQTFNSTNSGLAPSTYHSFSGDTSGNVAVLASYIPRPTGSGASIYQSGIANSDPSDNYFTFTVALAQDSAHPYTSGSFTLTLADQDTTIAQESFLSSSLLSNDFQDFSIQGYGAGASSFSILIQAQGTGTLLADNASLTGSAVPEPADWGWLPFLGTIAFLAFRRFRGTAKA